MKIKLLFNFGGRETQERRYLPGSEIDLADSILANVLIDNGRAELVRVLIAEPIAEPVEIAEVIPQPIKRRRNG